MLTSHFVRRIIINKAMLGYCSSVARTTGLLVLVFISLYSIRYTLYPSSVIAQESQPSPSSGVEDCISGDSHEKALCNLNNGLTPFGKTIEPVAEENVLKAIINKFTSFLGYAPKFLGLFTGRAQLQAQSTVPGEIMSQSEDYAQKAGEDLGTNVVGSSPSPNPSGLINANNDQGVGIYQVNLPTDIQKELKDTCSFENQYAASYFPPGINPFGDCKK